MRVAVVGGGITGLVAARALVRSGVETLLLEADRRLGGKVRTERQSGFLIEAGPESFVTRKPALLDLCRDLGLEREILFSSPAGTAVFARGCLRNLPAGMGIAPTRLAPLLRSGILTPIEKLRLLGDLVLPGRPGTGDESLGSLVRRRLGRAALDRLVGPIAAGIYAGDPDRLSVAATFPELLEAARGGSLIRSLAAATRSASPVMRTASRGGRSHGPFATLEGGLERLVERLTEELIGADVRTGARVDRLTAAPQGWRIELAERPPIAVDGAILAIPAPVAGRLLRDAAPGAARLLARIPRVSTMVVTLGYSARDVRAPQGNGFVVARDERLPITACTFSSSKWPGRAPAGRVLVRAYLGDACQPLEPDLDDHELVARARQGLRATMGWRADPILARVDRWPDAMPQYEVGHVAGVVAIERALDAAPGIRVAGADYRGAGLADCVAQAEVAARTWRPLRMNRPQAHG